MRGGGDVTFVVSRIDFNISLFNISPLFSEGERGRQEAHLVQLHFLHMRNE